MITIFQLQTMSAGDDYCVIFQLSINVHVTVEYIKSTKINMLQLELKPLAQ